MRLVRVCLVAIALIVPCRLANADILTNCATIAANSANPMATNVDLWLSRFREAYAACLAQQDIKAVTPVSVKTAAKTFSKPKHKSAKRVVPKPTKKIQIVPARLVRVPKSNVPASGAESWRMNCSERFGGINKVSQTYLSSTGKRVSCVIRP